MRALIAEQGDRAFELALPQIDRRLRAGMARTGDDDVVFPAGMFAFHTRRGAASARAMQYGRGLLTPPKPRLIAPRSGGQTRPDPLWGGVAQVVRAAES